MRFVYNPNGGISTAGIIGVLNTRYTEPDEIFAAAATGDVTLLSRNWLVEFAHAYSTTKEPLPRRQDLPPEAIVSVERLRALHEKAAPHVGRAVLPIMAVSYAWLTPEHPDPQGRQLRHVAKMLLWHGQHNQPWIEDYYDDFGIFWECVRP